MCKHLICMMEGFTMKKVLLLMVIMLLAVVAGCNTTTPKDAPDQKEQKTEMSQPTVSMAPVVVKYVSPAKQEMKKVIPSKGELDGTVMHERENIVYCEEVSDNSIEDNCFTNPDYVVAVASKSPNFCNGLDNYRKSECLTYLQEGYGVNE